ncbi:HlyD family type I secretion periplasmic adaptor subunit [Frigidibacter oleivorans]|uniref:HlyD family type I secretion periplasmic adaptor subunit n=1 Tax=Frigidibacter oleivorans TaxID=2487129 RepID=UPI000F8C3073|nr:HlyD family type I secretion periplasmic adaptor subunit [Frigidibacter oleivorans]
MGAEANLSLDTLRSAALALPRGSATTREDVGLKTGLRLPLMLGAVGSVLLLGALVGWAAVTPIGSAVIASGQAVVRGQPKLVQSLDGGIVAAIEVANGARVARGDLLLRLDPTLLAVNLDIARGRLAEALAWRARLEAEQQGLASLRFVYAALPFALPDTARAEAGQTRIFEARRILLSGQEAQGREKVAQLDNQIAGAEGQLAATRERLSLLDSELADFRRLKDQGLVRDSQVKELQRDRAEVAGEIAALQAEAARLANALRDAELTTLQDRRSFTEQVVTELREVTAEIEELTIEIVTTMAQLDRVEIRAPADGVVHELAATTIGGVIAPGATILQIIPLDEGVEFELQVDPRRIDEVWPGQPAQLAIASLDSRDMPKLAATVASVAPASVRDPVSDRAFYRVTLEVPPGELARLDGVSLVPGMPAEAFLETGSHTVLSYLLDPLASQLDRAFRE